MKCFKIGQFIVFERDLFTIVNSKRSCKENNGKLTVCHHMRPLIYLLFNLKYKTSIRFVCNPSFLGRPFLIMPFWVVMIQKPKNQN